MMKNSKEIDYEDLANKVSALFGNLLDNAVGTDEFLKVLSEYSAHKKDDKNETDSKNSNEKCDDFHNLVEKYLQTTQTKNISNSNFV